MKKINSLLLMVFIIISNLFNAQTSTEHFETESNGSNSFTDNGVVFNILSHSGTFDIYHLANGGWNGTDIDTRFIDNSNSIGSNPSFSIKTTSNLFKANKFWVFTGNNLANPNTTGTLTVTGKLSGVTKFSAQKNIGFNTTVAINNGYTLIDMTNLNEQNYSNIVIDQLQITAGGNFQYLALDAFTWVKDSNIVIDPNALYVSAGIYGNVSCNGGSNGFATVNVSGGQTPYTYSWSPSGGTAATATGLVAGSYTVTVKDATNSSKTQSFTITQPAPIVVTVAGNTTCAGTPANVTATGSDQYLWYDQLTDTTPMYVGSTFTTPVLNTDRTFYVQGGKLSSQKTLQTTFASGNNHRGNMFNVTAQKELEISSFDVSPMGDTTVEIYYKKGTYAGFESNSPAWTLLGSAPVKSTGNPVNVVVGSLTIPAGETYALYITSNNTAVSLNYSNVVENQTYQDDNMAIANGIGLEYPFTHGTGAFFNSRAWNGRINYKLVECLSQRTSFFVNVNSTIAPTGDATQTFNAGDHLSVLTVNGQDVKWYVNATDASSHINELPSSTIIVNDTTYYATQTINGCESLGSLAIRAYNETLGVNNYDNSDISLYPNPVKSILNIKSDEEVKKVIIMDISGKKIKEQSMKGQAFLDIHNLLEGTYLVNIFTNKGMKSFKVIKN